jgi:predicted MPP superfamily phosphohydrolase
MPHIPVAVFLTVGSALIAAIHYFFFARLVRDTALPAPYRTVATSLIVLLGASIPFGFAGGRFLPRSVMRYLAWPPYLWMGAMLLLFMILVAAEIVRAGASASGVVEDAERRRFLARFLGGVSVAASGALSGFAYYSARRPVEIARVEVPLARLPRALEGFRIVQVSDLHVGPTLGREWLENVVSRINALSPDVVAITGDLMDGSVADLHHAMTALTELRSKHGTYFVTGNHEYYSGAAAWVAELTRLGVRVLRNERVSVGDGAASFDLAGIDDYRSRGLAPGHGPDLPRALNGRDPSRELVLLAHQPRAVFEAARLGVGLQLSGHTHGGQIWPWGYAVLVQQPFLAGLSRHEGTHIYVSRGTGYWGPPMRLGAPAEITEITLRAPA